VRSSTGLGPKAGVCPSPLAQAQTPLRCGGYALDRADADRPKPIHPVSRLYRRSSEAEVESLCGASGEAFVAMLLEIAAAYIDRDRPLGEQLGAGVSLPKPLGLAPAAPTA
jgi:hypothetical protein